MQKSAPDVVRTLTEAVYKSNFRSGIDTHSGVSYRYLSQSAKGPAWQYMVDSCCHSIMMAHIHPDHALSEFRTLIASQDERGFIGHIAFWGGGQFPGDIKYRIRSANYWRQRHTALMSPPLLAQTLERVSEVLGDSWIPTEFMDPLDRYHNWLAENRIRDSDGLLVIISPSESTLDRSPVFDEVLGSPQKGLGLRLRGQYVDFRNALSNFDSRKLMDGNGFQVKDVLVNALYADSLSTMARLHRAQGRINVANAYSTRSDLVVNSLVRKMWDRGRGAFFNLHGHQERRATPLAIGSLVPLILSNLPRDVVETLIHKHLYNRDEFWLRFPISSVAATESTFDPRGKNSGWRGATSVFTNWLIWRGLQRQGFSGEAAQLGAMTLSMVAQSGLHRFYHPYNGQGIGRADSPVSGLSLDMRILS